MDNLPDFDAMTTEELSEWLDDPDNMSRVLGDVRRWRRGDAVNMVINYPPSDEDVEIPVTLAPDQLVTIDKVCERLALGNDDPPGYSDRSSVVRAAVAWFMMMVNRGEEERRKIDGPDVPVQLSYGTYPNSRSVVLRGSPQDASAAEADPETGVVTLPYELADKLARRRWKYLAAEEQAIDHLNDTGQPTPE